MKKLTTIFGVLAALTIVAGVVHKTYHLPGAFYLLMLGIGFFLMMYMVLLCINKIRESWGLERVMHIVKYLSYMYLALGVLFLLQHYAGAFYMMDIGFGLFILGYLSLKFMVQRAKHPEGGALNKVLPSLIIAVLVFGMASRNMGERIFEGIVYSDMQVNKMTAASDTSLHHVMMEFEHNNSQFPAQMSSKFEKANTIKKMSNELVDYINQCRKEVITATNDGDYHEYSRIDGISGKANSYEPNRYFVGMEKDNSDGKAFEIKKKLTTYNDSVNIIMATDTSNHIALPIIMDGYIWKGTGEAIPWEIALFKDQMLISDLAYLDLLILSVRQTEKDIIASLLSDARAET
ncbi:MAG: hypothetical protein WCL06_10375, partial [Bacteroidota bacterium]